MANATGKIPTEVNGVPAISAEDISVEITQTQKVRKGAFGNYARAEGTPQYGATIKWGVLTDKQEFGILAAGAKGQIPGQNGFNFTYTLGTESYTLIDCGIATDSIQSDQDAEASRTTKLVALDQVRVS